ncbi:hypothetical protein [Kineococcus glutinatus]|uniref:hypothetical protein n=1 Tax=Kineococcus glutinatus TaxID=1070872 RepID=UPI0031EFA408
MHPELEAALAPLLADLDVSCGVLPLVDDKSWQDDPDAASCWLFSPDGTGTGVWIPTGQREVEQVVMLADQVQEWAVESLWMLDRSASWPACPYHPKRHPLAAREQAEQAVWTCPVLQERICAVGALSRTRIRRRKLRHHA